MCSGLTELPTEREGGLAPSGERVARVGELIRQRPKEGNFRMC